MMDMNSLSRNEAITNGHVTDKAAELSYLGTMSEDGKTEASVLMHSRCGLRLDMNLNKSALSIWISPQAGKNVDVFYRNFSNRDDHTNLFARILFPELAQKKFLYCEYDPFHSILVYEAQKIHLLVLLDKPIVLLWAESEEVVDFASDKQDSSLLRNSHCFVVQHPDRGLTFTFGAVLGKGESSFRHSPQIDRGRSIHARAILSSGQVLAIGGELSDEPVMDMIRDAVSTPIVDLLAENEAAIDQAIPFGRIHIKNSPDMQRLHDTNLRHLLSVQDASGAVRAALKHVYYLIWTTDGAVTSASMAQAGWTSFLRLWTDFLLQNPTVQTSPPAGRFFGQLTNPITKREEFGNFCAFLSAFMHWGLTDDPVFVAGKNLEVLEDAMSWMETYCWNDSVGAFGGYYEGGGSEDPFYGSHDFGWDAAVGSFMQRNPYAPMYEGRIILRSYEFSMNLNQYNMYLMLHAVLDGERSACYLEKAKRVEVFLLKLLMDKHQAYYLLAEEDALLPGKPAAGDITDLMPVPYGDGEMETGRFAIQNQHAAFFIPEYATVFMNRMRSFKPFTEESIQGTMPCVVYGQMAGLDTEFVDEEGIYASLLVSLPYHVNPTKYNPMPYTMVEVMGVQDGAFHDVRPQAFSAGPFQAAVTNLAIRVLPFGVAFRATRHIAILRHFEYLCGTLDVSFEGKGMIERIVLNDIALAGTLQIPDSLMQPGDNKAVVSLSETGTGTGAEGVLLVASTVRLLETEATICLEKNIAAEHKAEPSSTLQPNLAPSAMTYVVRGYGQNVMIFRENGLDFVVKNARNSMVEGKIECIGMHTFFTFWGKGDYRVQVTNPGAKSQGLPYKCVGKIT